jgi:sodium-coupled neutral amino acid transporter 11
VQRQSTTFEKRARLPIYQKKKVTPEIIRFRSLLLSLLFQNQNAGPGKPTPSFILVREDGDGACTALLKFDFINMATQHPPKSPFLAPRRSSYDIESPHVANAISSVKYNAAIEPEHKSNLLGCTANLITAIVGAGIIGIPYAMRETGLLAGWFLLVLSGVLGSKSLCLLVEMAKHVDAASYEVLSEAVFGKAGWVCCNAMMFCMSAGPMLSYLMLVKDTLGQLLGYDGSICLIISSLAVMLPLSLQRDMADLAKTSRFSVVLNIGLVGIIGMYSPTLESISNAGGFISVVSQSTIRPGTCFIGLGIISFAFSCHHSALIIAGSLENPTQARWSRASWSALGFCTILSIIMGTAGYCGFLEETTGNILKNFVKPLEDSSPKELTAAKAANVARCLLCGTMFFVYPLESFVCRHVIMTNLFQGRVAHEGDDHTVLDRWDRRVITTIALYLSVLIPALNFDDVGIVLALTGTVAASTLTYIGPGVLFIGIHGQEFLDLAESRSGAVDPNGDLVLQNQLFWYLFLMPIWCRIAAMGKRGLSLHHAKKEMMTPVVCRLGKMRHKHEIMKKQRQRRSIEDNDEDCEPENERFPDKLGLISMTRKNYVSHAVGLIALSKSYGSIGSDHRNGEIHEMISADCVEEDPQDDKQTAADFAVAIAFVIFGMIAFISGMVSIFRSS